MLKKLALLAALALAPSSAWATLADQSILWTDLTFQGRVQEALVGGCIAISNEGFAVVNHKKRADYCSNVLAGPANFKATFAISVSTDANVISDATAAGTVALTAGNVAAQAALVTDAHIANAISGQFNSFLVLP